VKQAKRTQHTGTKTWALGAVASGKRDRLLIQDLTGSPNGAHQARHHGRESDGHSPRYYG